MHFYKEQSINLNPFSETAIISYDLQTACKVKIEIYNSIGEKITTLVDDWQETGRHSEVFKAEGLMQGMYFYIVQIGQKIESGKIIIIK